MPSCLSSFFFFNDTATTEIYTLSLHDALPISKTACPDHGELAIKCCRACPSSPVMFRAIVAKFRALSMVKDRKSTRLNSSHSQISYAVFCLKKKKQILSEERAKYATVHAANDL